MRKALWFALAAVGLSMTSAKAQTVIFRDDFNGTALDSAKWSLGTWRLGRTQLGNSPVIGGGIARLTFDTYGLKGTEIWTKGLFSRGTNGLEIEARVKLNNLPSGLVTSLFTYNVNASNWADEIDFEMLSKQVNLTTGGDPILTTIWNDWGAAGSTYGNGINHWSVSNFVAGLDVNTWHTYTIRWLPDRTEWLLDGSLLYSTNKAQPELSTYVRLNFWAPNSDWTDAYDASLKIARRSVDNKRYFYDVDWVEVRQL